MKQLFTLTFLSLGYTLAAQLNTTLLGNLDYEVAVNDVWGYVAPDGTEYAIVGLFDGVSIVSLADATQPVEVARAEGQNSNWRDMKVYRDYAYAVADQGDEGLTIIDLRGLPESISTINRQYVLPDSERTFVRAHNIYIDTAQGLAYTAGGDRSFNDGGVLVFDVGADPLAPPLVGVGPSTYAHDVYVQDGRMYASEIYLGELAIYDVSDLTAITELGRTRTPFTFTHNAWTSTDGTKVFTTDERRNASVASYDISALDDIRLLDEYRPLTSLNTNTIPHNVQFIDDYLSISHYTDGLRVVDASDPANLVEVANYDTWPGADGGFNGAWGAFPYLPSGHTLVSDRQTGLYVVDVTYVRAARLRGEVADLTTGEAINGATVTLLDAQANQAVTDAAGAYATGVAAAGSYRVRVSGPGYFADTVEVELANGQTAVLDVLLEPQVLDTLRVFLRDQDADTLLPGAILQLFAADTSFQARSDSAGVVHFVSLPNLPYRTVATAWGYRASAGETTEALLLADSTLYLMAGYEDSFITDLGWTVSDTASSGQWQRGRQGMDTDDLGALAYYTGPTDTFPDTNSLDTGCTVLLSPYFQVADYADDLTMSYAYQFSGAESGGTYTVSLISPNDTVLLADYTVATDGWTADTIDLSGPLPRPDSLRIMIAVCDTALTDTAVEAAFDNLALAGTLLSSTVGDIPLTTGFTVYPNPSTHGFTLHLPDDQQRAPHRLTLYDLRGRRLQVLPAVVPGQRVTFGAGLRPGVYFLRVEAEGSLPGIRKLIKH